MAAGFFEFIPTILYNNKKAKNLLVSSKLRDTVLGNRKAFFRYTVKEGETPESVALKFYGSAKMSWLVHFSNLHMDPYHDWPMSYLEFIRYLKQKYGSVPAAKANIEYYEHPDYTFNINVPTYERYSNADFIDSTLSVDRTGWTAVESYTREVQENDDKRNIDLLHPDFVYIVERELEEIYS